MEKMGSNKYGKISKLEAKGKLTENFKTRHKNNDGFISKNEMTRKKTIKNGYNNCYN